MEGKKIEAEKNWLNQVLLGFASFYRRFISFYRRFISFYRRFIQGLSKLAEPLTLMLRMSSIQSAKNSLLSMDGAEDAEVRSGMSSTTRSVKNSPSDMAEDAEVGGNGDGDDDETVERSLLSKKPNGPIEYLTSLRSDADNAPFEKR